MKFIHSTAIRLAAVSVLMGMATLGFAEETAVAVEAVADPVPAKVQSEPTLWDKVQERRTEMREVMQRRQARRVQLMSTLPEARVINEEISTLQTQLRKKQEELESLLRGDADYAALAAEQDRLLKDMTELQRKHAGKIRAQAKDPVVEQSVSEVSP